jgi:hypothetical protein
MFDYVLLVPAWENLARPFTRRSREDKNHEESKPHSNKGSALITIYL